MIAIYKRHDEGGQEPSSVVAACSVVADLFACPLRQQSTLSRTNTTTNKEGLTMLGEAGNSIVHNWPSRVREVLDSAEPRRYASRGSFDRTIADSRPLSEAVWRRVGGVRTARGTTHDNRD